MEEPNRTQNPGKRDFDHSDENLDGLGNRSTTDSTSEMTGSFRLEPPIVDSHSSALVHINSAYPMIDDLQSQNDDLRRQNMALEEEVAQYQVAHLRELPEDHITDATAQRLYEGIQDSIEQWVYNITGRSSAADWLNKYEKRLRASKQDLKSGKAPAFFEYMPGFFRDPKAYKASESIDCFFLSWFITYSLAMIVFDNRYPLGIDGNQANFLNHAIEAMRNSGAQYDEQYIHKWRTQTLSVLMGHPDFGKSHKKLFDNQYGEMRRHLLQWLPREETFLEHEEELKESIFREAVMLQQKMGIAADDYRIIVDSFDSRLAAHRKVTYRNLITFRPIDAQDIRHIYGCLFPSLCRIDTRGQCRYITEPVFIADPALTQSLQQSVEARPKLRDRELIKSPTEPTTKRNDRSLGWSTRWTELDRENSPKRRTKLSMARSSSTQ